MPPDAFDQHRNAASRGAWDSPARPGHGGPPPPPQQVVVHPAPAASQHGYPAQASPVVVVPLKTPGIAVLLSFLWLGAGHLYAGRTAVGVVLLVLDLFIVLIALIPFIGWILAPLLWVPAVIVAAITAAAAARGYNDRVLHGTRR